MNGRGGIGRRRGSAAAGGSWVDAPRPKRQDREGPVQTAIVNYLRATLPAHFKVKHTANRPRSRTQGAREKRMGAIAGWPDLEVWGSGRVHLIEVKDEGEGVPAYQLQLHAELRATGFEVGIARSIGDASDLVRLWNLPTRDAALAQRAAPRPPGGPSSTPFHHP